MQIPIFKSICFERHLYLLKNNSKIKLLNATHKAQFCTKPVYVWSVFIRKKLLIDVSFNQRLIAVTEKEIFT